MILEEIQCFLLGAGSAGDGRDAGSPGKLIRVLGDEAHTRKNIEKMLEYENKSGQTTVRPDGCFEIVFQA